MNKKFLFMLLLLEKVPQDGWWKGYLFFFFVFFAISWAAPTAYGGSHARGRIGAVASG